MMSVTTAIIQGGEAGNTRLLTERMSERLTSSAAMQRSATPPQCGKPSAGQQVPWDEDEQRRRHAEIKVEPAVVVAEVVQPVHRVDAEGLVGDRVVRVAELHADPAGASLSTLRCPDRRPRASRL